MKCSLIAVTAFAVCLLGCGPQLNTGGGGDNMARLRSKAPVYAGGPVGAFIDGKWTEALEVSDKEAAELPIAEVYTFKSDGGFTIEKNGHKVGGKWTEANGIITLNYTMLDDKPWVEAYNDIQKRAESGGQAAIADSLIFDWLNSDLQKATKFTLDQDKKRLTFAPSAPPVAEGMSSLGFANLPVLERIGKG